nr:MAG TPA: hypothetical protein [Bacteriophage sp.]
MIRKNNSKRKGGLRTAPFQYKYWGKVRKKCIKQLK